MLISRPRRPHPCPPPLSQRGIGLLQVVLILVLVAAITAAGFQVLQSRVAPDARLGEEQALAWADQAVAAFAAANSRLPCPSAEPDGKEDCALGLSKGYLPTSTLDTFFDHNSTSIIGASGLGQLPSPVLYAVYRPPGAAPTTDGDDVDLSVADTRYTPLRYDPENKKYEPRPEFDKTKSEKANYDAINGLDFCAALGEASVLSYQNGRLNVSPGSGINLNVAYGVAVAGPTPGRNGRFDDANRSNDITLAAPDATASADYDDRVRVRTFDNLAQAVGCSLLNPLVADRGRPAFTDTVPVASTDQVASTAEISDSIADTQSNTQQSAQGAVDGGIQSVVFGTIGVALNGVAVGASGVDLGEAIGLLAQNVVRCAASLGVECWRIPFSTAAIVAQATALGLNITALGTSIAALALSGVSLADAKTALALANAAKDANDDVGNLDKAVEQACRTAYGGRKYSNKCPDGTDEEDSIKGMQQVWEELELEAVTAEKARDDFGKEYIAPWWPERLHERIAGYDHMSEAGKSNAITLLQHQLLTATNLMDARMKRDELQGNDKAYKERQSQLQQMVDPGGSFVTENNDLCTKSDYLNQQKCKSNKAQIDYAKTCIRDGVLEVYDAKKPASDGPYCLPALADAITENQKALISWKNTELASAQAAADASGATKEGWAKYEPEVKDKDGKVIKAAYYWWYEPYGYRYPSNWTYCTKEMKGDDKCSDLTVLFAHWQYGNYLPLVRNDSASGAWLSFGDAYREYKIRDNTAQKARVAANEAKDQYCKKDEADEKCVGGAVAAYEELLRVQIGGGGGDDIEFWIGADSILKGIDDRGAVGPDRNDTTQSTVNP